MTMKVFFCLGNCEHMQIREDHLCWLSEEARDDLAGEICPLCGNDLIPVCDANDGELVDVIDLGDLQLTCGGIRI